MNTLNTPHEIWIYDKHSGEHMGTIKHNCPDSMPQLERLEDAQAIVTEWAKNNLLPENKYEYEVS